MLTLRHTFSGSLHWLPHPITNHWNTPSHPLPSMTSSPPLPPPFSPPWSVSNLCLWAATTLPLFLAMAKCRTYTQINTQKQMNMNKMSVPVPATYVHSVISYWYLYCNITGDFNFA